MSDEMDLNAYINSPFASDLKKQRDAAFDSARNIRKVTETPEEYKARMLQQEMAAKQILKASNTDVLKERLGTIDISGIATKNRTAVEAMIREAEALKIVALNNNCDKNSNEFKNLDKFIKTAQQRLQTLKKNDNKKTIGTGIFSDSYHKSDDNDDLLSKLLGN